MSRLLPLLYLATISFAFATPPEPITIANRKQQMFVRTDGSLLNNETGLLVWSEGGQDVWRIKSNGDTAPTATSQLFSNSRGVITLQQGVTSPRQTSRLYSSRNLDQLLGQLVIRGTGFITPRHNGRYLDRKITFRRRVAGGKRLPATTAEIYQGSKLIFKVPLAEGAELVRWSDIPGLPESLREGLPAGGYNVRLPDGKDNTRFTIEDTETRGWVLERSYRLSEIVGANHPAVPIVTVDEMLNSSDENGKPIAYLGDILDYISTLPDNAKTEYLSRCFREVTDRLVLSSSQTAATNEDSRGQIGDPTGIESIDHARACILRSEWETARSLLLSEIESDDSRTAGLAYLYLGVIWSESAATDAAAISADQFFGKALELLRESEVTDRFRVHNNYANLLLAKSQDGLYNHARQASSGVINPLLKSLHKWRAAHEHYLTALKLSDELSTDSKAAVQINLSRTKAHLADILSSLARNEVELKAVGFPEILNEAQKLASAAGTTADDQVRAAAAELLGHLAYRANDYTDCEKHTRVALNSYCNDGSLAGVETSLRSIGMSQIRRGNDPDGLKTLKASEIIAELLRERISTDVSGSLRSGFFARRAYVNQQIVEVLIRQGRTKEALQAAERSKARSLEDLLSSGEIDRSTSEHDESQNLEDLLAAWEDGYVALEYFFGSEQCWVFVVSKAGVDVYPLTDDEGQPVSPENLAKSVTKFVRSMNGKAKQMLSEYRRTDRFSHLWQNELHTFYNTLIPKLARDRVLHSKNLIVVPYHVLHYFPFAALVTALDEGAPEGFQTVMPSFLIESGTSVSYSPSLRTWSMLRARDVPLENVNAVGIVEFESAPSLPGVKTDLKNLKQHFGSKIDTYLEEQAATETDVTELLSKPGMLFFATHGLNVADHPLASYILTHRDRESDGKLTAGEVFSTEVNADMIVMSACFTGLADRSPLPGDDLFGLQRAFLSSGANSVVSGQWDVYEGTAPLLMADMFEQLNAGLSVADALATAQREFIDERRRKGRREVWIHPYFWAVYTAAGSNATAFEKSKN